MIVLKRIYDTPSPNDGFRVLVERLWPRGVSKEKAHVDLWLKEIAPSTELRKWFNHEPPKWAEFCERYAAELTDKTDLLDKLAEKSRAGTVTFVFASKDTTHNNAVALKELIEQRVRFHSSF